MSVRKSGKHPKSIMLESGIQMTTVGTRVFNFQMVNGSTQTIIVDANTDSEAETKAIMQALWNEPCTRKDRLVFVQQLSVILLDERYTKSMIEDIRDTSLDFVRIHSHKQIPYWVNRFQKKHPNNKICVCTKNPEQFESDLLWITSPLVMREYMAFHDPIKFQAFSDLHLETWQGSFQWPTIDESVHVVILAGDIGLPTQDTWKHIETFVNTHDVHVIMVPGNHEYYTKQTMEEVDYFWVQKADQHSRFHFLNKDKFVLRDVDFLGCTLWTKLPRPSNWNIVNEINWGKDQDKVKSYNEVHKDHKRFIYESLDKSNPTVVITHHAPHIRCIHPKYHTTTSDINFSFYAYDIHNFEGINYWIHGHTHTGLDVYKGGCTIINNPCGCYTDTTRNIKREERVFTV